MSRYQFRAKCVIDTVAWIFLSYCRPWWWVSACSSYLMCRRFVYCRLCGSYGKTGRGFGADSWSRRRLRCAPCENVTFDQIPERFEHVAATLGASRAVFWTVALQQARRGLAAVTWRGRVRWCSALLGVRRHTRLRTDKVRHHLLGNAGRKHRFPAAVSKLMICDGDDCLNDHPLARGKNLA